MEPRRREPFPENDHGHHTLVLHHRKAELRISCEQATSAIQARGWNNTHIKNNTNIWGSIRNLHTPGIPLWSSSKTGRKCHGFLGQALDYPPAHLSSLLETTWRYPHHCFCHAEFTSEFFEKFNFKIKLE